MTAFERARERVRVAVEDDGLPSCVVAVARHGEVVCAVEAGEARPGAGATLDTTYSLASVTKPLTGLVLASFAQRGLLDLDAPVARHLRGVPLPIAPEDLDAVTWRRLANHTAGLGLSHRFHYDEPPDRRGFAAAHAALVTPPGLRFHYANLGFGLIDLALEELTGVPFDDLLPTEVAQLCGIDVSVGAEGDAWRYGADGVAYPPYRTDHPGASEAWASASALLALGSALCDDDGLRDLLEPGRLVATPDSIGDDPGYGLGWQHRTLGGHRVLGHSGGMGGVATLLQVVPASGVVGVALANAASSAPAEALLLALSDVLPGFPDAIPVPPEPPPVPDDVTGHHELLVLSGRDEVPLAVDLARGTMRGSMGGAAAEADVRGNGSGGAVAHLDLPLPCEAAAGTNQVVVDLCRVGGRLIGQVVAVHDPGAEGGAPGRRVGDALPFRCVPATG